MMIRTTSIRTKLIALMLIATVIPTVLSMAITYAYTKETLKNRTVRENANLLFQARSNIVNYMNSLNQTTFLVYNGRPFQTSDSMLRIMQTGADDYVSRGELYTSLQNILHAVKGTFQVRLYVNASKQTTLLINDSAKRSYQEQNEVTFPPGVDSYVQPSHESSYYGMQQQFPYYPPETVISMHRIIYDVPSTKVLGTLSIDAGLDVLREICDPLVVQDREELYLLNEQGQIIYTTANEPERAQMSAWLHVMLQRHAAPEGSFDGDQATHVYTRMETPYMNWVLVKRVPDAFLYESARELNLILMAIAVVSLLIIVAATLAISLRITSPIKRLIGYITKIQTGRLDVRIAVDSQDEIGILAQRFQSMMETINNLVLKEYKLELANKTNELKVLQAQVNPHFLNNALQSIGTLALRLGATQIYSLLSSLARMMRYNMTTETTVPLKKELEHVKAYLALQKQRFDDQVDIVYELDEQTYDCLVPKMIVQPIVENYFKHAFHQAGGSEGTIGKLTVRSEQIGDMLRLTIEDNGPGISPGRLELLRAELAQGAGAAPGEEEGIGLRNVQQRLRLYFGERAGLTAANAADGGAVVHIEVPIQKDTEANPI
ncbi:sensor histidine kinase [Paenibacillus chartarius]|uniref:histidine kinase n=1 Tax=Paenibacillus chartarius TaxID=747481 RepID=A0ABV6DK85_9BACL